MCVAETNSAGVFYTLDCVRSMNFDTMNAQKGREKVKRISVGFTRKFEKVKFFSAFQAVGNNRYSVGLNTTHIFGPVMSGTNFLNSAPPIESDVILVLRRHGMNQQLELRWRFF